MSDFNRLMRYLEQELIQQEKLLDVLSRERAAIVGLKQDQIDLLRRRKEELVQEAQGVAKKRDETLSNILGAPTPAQPAKFADVLAKCPNRDIRAKLEDIGKELKTAAKAVQELNNENAELIRQSLGLVVSTIAIFRGVAGSELPTYNQSGALQEKSSSPYSAKSSTITRDA